MKLGICPGPVRRALALALAAGSLACLGSVLATPRAEPRDPGGGGYRGNPPPGARGLGGGGGAAGDGRPTGEVLGHARTDAQGRFVVDVMKAADEPVSLAVSAVRESADSEGDRRSEGYEIKSRRTLLGYLPHPNLSKPNTILIERRRLGGGERGPNDD